LGTAVPLCGPDRSRGSPATLELGLVIPLRGPAGIVGPSCEASAELAVEEINLGAGLLGREVRLVVIDGGAAPEQVAAEVDGLVSAGAVDAVTGWHLSSVRQAIVSRIAGRVPYVYTPLYEGGEGAPGVFLAGETPAIQVRPALRWLMAEHGVRRWCIVGDDYVWPRGTARAARRYIHELGGELRGACFVALGSEDFTPVLRRIERSGADAVLMLLVGQDAVLFNRAFARAGLDQRCLRFSPLLEENMLMGSGAGSTRGLYTAAGYFDALPTGDNLDFHHLYRRRFGPDAPVLGSLGESCYEGILLLSALARRAGGLDPGRMSGIADRVGYDGPRGAVHLHNRHLSQHVYLAEASGLDFEIVTAL
jgi:ABC-type branched-subunit amino acid transport system substrate-binding protein